MQQTLLKIFSFKTSLLFLLLLISPAHTMDLFNAAAKMLVNPTPTGSADIINGYTPTERQILTLVKQDPTVLKSLEEKGDISFNHKTIVPGFGSAFTSSDTKQMIAHCYSYSNTIDAHNLPNIQVKQQEKQMHSQPQSEQKRNSQLHSYNVKSDLSKQISTPEEQTKALEDQVCALQLEQFSSFSHSLNDSLDLGAQLFMLGKDPIAAAQFKNFEAATLKIGDSLNAIMMGSSEAMFASSGNPYIGLALGVSSLIGSILDDGSGDFGEILQQYFVALSEQLNRQFEFTMQRFDMLEEKLDCHSRNMVQGFFTLNQQQDKSFDHLIALRNNFLEKSAIAQCGTNYLEQSLAHKYSSITSHLQALRTEKINEIVHDAFHNGTKKSLPSKKFDKHLNKLYTKALVRGAVPHLNGGDIKIENHEAIALALQQDDTKVSRSIMHHPAFAHLSLIKQITHTNTDQPLVNPLIWIQCADAFARILQKKVSTDQHYPPTQEDKTQLITMIKKMHAAGSGINTFLESLHKNKTIDSIIKQYQHSLQEINHQFQALLNAYQQDTQNQIQKKLHDNQNADSFTVTNQLINCKNNKDIIEQMRVATTLIRSSFNPNPDNDFSESNHLSLSYRNFNYKGKNINGTQQVLDLLNQEPASTEKKAQDFLINKCNQLLKAATTHDNICFIQSTR